MKRYRLIVTVLLLLLLSPLRWAQAAPQMQGEPTLQPPTQEPPQDEGEPVTFSGMVLTSSQIALPGATISANPTDPELPGYYGFGGTTDDAGRFVLQLIAGVPYRIMLCYSDICYYYHPDGLKPRPEDGAVITPQLGANYSDLVIQWVEPVTFSGIVTGPNGQGIGSINIAAEVIVKGQPVPYNTRTQDGGYYTLTVPARQVYRISASPGMPDQPYKREYYQNVTDPAQAVSFDAITPGITFPGIDFQLEDMPSFYVSGVIRDEHQQPLQGANIIIQNLTNPGDSTPFISTDAQGRYRVRLEPGASYYFQFSASDYPSMFYTSSGGTPVYPLAEAITGAAGEERTIDYQFQAPVTFSGTVTKWTGEVLGGVQVMVYEKTTGLLTTNTPTQPDGSFSLTAPAGSDYSISAGPVEGTAPLQKEYYPNQTNPDLATFFTGTPGAHYAALTFALGPTPIFRIVGKVTGPDGSVLAGVPVSVWDEKGTSTITETSTDENGVYRASLSPGKNLMLSACAECAGYPYGTLYYTAAGGLPLRSLAEKITPVDGQTRTGMDFHFRQPVTFSGWAKDTQGNPLQGVWVGVEEAVTRQGIASGVTGADGRYAVQAPPGMAMRLAVYPDTRVQRKRWEYYDNQTTWEAAAIFDGDTPGAIYSGRNFILEPLPTTYVSGVVRGPDGRPLVGVLVNASSTNWRANYNQATTGIDGRYRLALDAGLPYTILACASCNQLLYGDLYYHKAGNTAIYENAQILTGADGQESPGIDFQFSDPVAISGRVTGPDGSPLENTTVHAEDAAGDAWLAFDSTDSQGRYTLYVEPGYPVRLAVNPYMSGEGLASEYYPNQYSPAQARIFEGAPGERFESIDFQVEKELTITGRVSNHNGAPLFNVEVDCEQEGENPSCGSVFTDSMGVYTLHVQPGPPYRISAGGQAVNGLVYSRVYATGTPLCSHAGLLSGGPGETLRGVDFHLVPAVTVSGHVYAPDGAPLKDASVTVLGEADQDKLGTATTGADGSYTAYIHPGLSYTVRVDPGIYPFPMEYYNDAPNRAQAAILTGDNRQGVDINLNSPAVLRGRVTMPDGSPLFFPNVTALDAASGEVLIYSASQEDGSYTMYLRSGHAYHIQVWPRVYEDNFLAEYWENRHDRAQAAAVQMAAPGTERIINLQVHPLATTTQAALAGMPFTYTIPDAGPDLTFSASLANGAALPAWLHYDPATRTFYGTPTPADAGRMNVRLTVSYDGGRQSVRTFIVTVGRSMSIYLPVIRK